jgi:hypothetical protein
MLQAVLLLIVCLCISLIDSGLQKREIEEPLSSKILQFDENVTFNCKTSLSKPVIWYFIPADNPNDDRNIFNGKRLIVPMRSRYVMDIDVETGKYNLVIPKVDKQHAGKYECIENDGFGEKSSAELVVVGNSLQCDFADNCKIEVYGKHDYNNCTKTVSKSGVEDCPHCQTFEKDPRHCRVCLESNSRHRRSTENCQFHTQYTEHDNEGLNDEESIQETNEKTENNEKQASEPETSLVSIIIPIIIVLLVVPIAIVVAIILLRRKRQANMSTHLTEEGVVGISIQEPFMKSNETNHRPIT